MATAKKVGAFTQAKILRLITEISKEIDFSILGKYTGQTNITAEMAADLSALIMDGLSDDVLTKIREIIELVSDIDSKELETISLEEIVDLFNTAWLLNNITGQMESLKKRFSAIMGEPQPKQMN